MNDFFYMLNSKSVIFAVVVLLLFLLTFIYKKLFSVKTKQFVKIKSFDEFEDWKTKYEESLNDNKKIVKKIKTKFRVHLALIICYITILIGLVTHFVERNLSLAMTIFTVMLMLLSIWMIYLIWLNKETKGMVKEKIIGIFLSKIDSSFLYESHANSDKQESTKAYQKYFPLRYQEECEIEDFIKGNGFEMVDLKVIRRGNRESRFMKIKCNFVMINVEHSFPNIIITRNNLKSMKKDDEESIQYFDSVREHLSDTLLNYLMNFREEFGIEYDIIFDDKIYVRFYTGDMFETATWSNAVDQQSIYKFYCITKFIKDIQEIMKKSI